VWGVDFTALFTINSKRSPYEKTCCLLRCARNLLRTVLLPIPLHTNTSLTHTLVSCVIFAWRA
jgi:hypothetical protein